MTDMQKKPQEEKREGRVTAVLKDLLRLVRNNWPYKVVALVLAVVMWAVLITQDPLLTREKVMTGPVSIIGSDNIKRNGFIVTGGLESLGDVTIRAEVPQGQYQTASTSAYNLRVDLSRISGSGTQDIRILSSNSTTYGSVTEISPSAVTVTVEDYITRSRIPVMVVASGEMAAGWYAGPASVDPPYVTVQGPRSVVEGIRRCYADLDLSDLPAGEGTVRSAVSFRMIGADGQEIDTDMVEITSESVLIDTILCEQDIVPTKVIALGELGMVSGTPAEGYEVKNITYTPETVTAAGPGETLEGLETLYTESAVSVAGLTESVSREVRIRKPDTLTSLSQDSVTVAVEIGPVIVSRTFRGVSIETTGTGNGLKARLAERTADVTVTGPSLWVNSLTAGQITLTCDLSGLEAGVHDMPIACTVAGAEGVDCTAAASPSTVRVTISEQ